MEKRPGFKECPKCGLRNKPSATQCDFCGQNLGPSDDWQQHIRDLESLNKMELRRPLDDRTSKRIESTIIRKDAPVVRNVEIREAGNIGKALRDLDMPPIKEKGRELKDEKHRQPVQDKLRIKEARSVPLVEEEVESNKEAIQGTTIADILKGPSKEVSVPAEEPSPVHQEMPKVLSPRSASEEVIGADESEPAQEAETISEPENTDVPPSQISEPSLDLEPEKNNVPASPVVTVGETVPAKEVTVEVVQPAQEEMVSEQHLGDGEGEVAMSTTDSHETIKLKLVKVERPKEMLAPMLVATHAGERGMAAMAVLAVGTIAYLIVLTLTSLGTLSTVTGLGGGAVSSFMIIFGAAAVYPSIRKRKENEVYICPKCHEKVGESSEACPACGAEFESED